ncbi:MAG: BatA domain-containing protein, partial [Bosea sp. (in: a-proteobacteria)]
MFGLPLAFSAPLVLTGLALLPVLWWLLRVTPPRPQRIAFPPLAIARDLVPERQTPSNTPWWLLLIRLAVAALIILAAAGPVLSPQLREGAAPSGPTIILIDNGFTAARDWQERMALAEARIGNAAREGQGAAIIGLAELPGDVAIGAPQAALERLRALALRPHAADRAVHLPSIEAALARWPQAHLIWISDGVAVSDAAPFLAKMREWGSAGRLVIHADPPAGLALSSAENQNQALNVKVLRPLATGASDGIIRAQDVKGLPLGEAPFVFGPAATETIARLQMPIELRNAVSRLEIEGERSAGAVHLVDERGKRRRIGIITAVTADTAQPLLSPVYYVTRALSPFAELREPPAGATDPIGTLIGQNLSLLVLADVAAFDREATDRLNSFVDRGGVIVRFAGPRLAAGGDALSPVRLRRGGRSLGGALSWDAPKKLAPFTRQSPFDGLTTPDEV